MMQRIIKTLLRILSRREAGKERPDMCFTRLILRTEFVNQMKDSGVLNQPNCREGGEESLIPGIILKIF